jgi:hypothetical protein
VTEPNLTTSEVNDLQPQAPVPNPEPPEEPKAGAEAAADAGAVEGGEEPTPTTPPERTYSQAEWEKRESSVQQKLTKAQQESQKAIEEANRQAKEAIAAYQRQQDDAFLARVEQEGGDIQAARGQLAKEQAIREREAKIAERETALEQQGARLLQIAKEADAVRLAKEHGLTDTAPLMEAENPTQMENIALKLALEAKGTATKPAVKTDKGVSTAAGRAGDWSKLSPAEKLAKGTEGMF